LVKEEISKVIITRPDGQADSLLQKLSDSIGHLVQFTHLPLLSILPLSVSRPEIDKFAGVIFVSPNAVKHFFNQFSDVTFDAKMPIVAVGLKTAEILEKKLNHKILYPTSMNSEGVIDLPVLQQIEGQQWLMIKGEGGRDLILETLQKRGASVETMDVYRRELPSINLQHEIANTLKEAALWVITSKDALQNLIAIGNLEKIANHQTKVLVSSDRLKAIAIEKGFVIATQSADASEAQLVQSLNNFMLN